MSEDHVYTWEEGARLARGQYQDDNEYPHKLERAGMLSINEARMRHDLPPIEPSKREAVSMGLVSKQAVKDESEPFKLDSGLLGDDPGWTDIPFWFAWVCWSGPIVLLTDAAGALFAPGSGVKAVVIANALALIAGLIVTTVTKRGHEYLGWFGGVPKGRVVKCDSSYNTDIPPINVGDEETPAHQKCKQFYPGDMQAYEKCIVDEYWREQDAHNGLHRQDKPYNTDAVPTSPIKRGSGLHRFTFTIGFQHERSKDSRVREEE